MTEKIMNIKSISQFHETINFEPPKHPLISVIDVSKMQFPSALIGTKISTSFYTIIHPVLLMLLLSTDSCDADTT